MAKIPCFYGKTYKGHLCIGSLSKGYNDLKSLDHGSHGISEQVAGWRAMRAWVSGRLFPSIIAWSINARRSRSSVRFSSGPFWMGLHIALLLTAPVVECSKASTAISDSDVLKHDNVIIEAYQSTENLDTPTTRRTSGACNHLPGRRGIRGRNGLITT